MLISVITEVKKRIIFFCWLLKVRAYTLFNAGEDVHRALIFISPFSIVYESLDSDLLSRKGNNYEFLHTLPGDWDLNLQRVDEMDFIKAGEEVYLKNMPWQSTCFYKRICEEIKSGKKRFGCTSVESFDARLHKDAALIDHIQKTGYLSQRELKTFKPWDEVRVCIDRYGRYIFLDGRHRLLAARLLNIEKIPVQVTYIHPTYKSQLS